MGHALADAYFSRATLLNQAGKPTEAIEDYNEALALNPENADAFCGRGAAYLATGSLEQALLDVNDAIRREPNSHEVLCLRARVSLAAGKFDDAITDARQAIHLDAKCGDAYLTLGTALLSLPNQAPDAAVKCLLEAFDRYKALKPPFNPELARAYRKLSISFNMAGNEQKANQALSEARALDPKIARARHPVSRNSLIPSSFGRNLCLLGSSSTMLFANSPPFCGWIPRTSLHCLDVVPRSWARRIGIRPLGTLTE